MNYQILKDALKQRFMLWKWIGLKRKLETSKVQEDWCSASVKNWESQQTLSNQLIAAEKIHCRIEKISVFQVISCMWCCFLKCFCDNHWMCCNKYISEIILMIQRLIISKSERFIIGWTKSVVYSAEILHIGCFCYSLM